MTSKAVEVKKNLNLGLAVRTSTWNHPLIKAKDDEWGKLLTVIDNFGKLQFGTDNRMVIYPYALPLARDVGIEALEKGMSGAEIAETVAKAIDDFIYEEGWNEVDVGPPY